MPNTSRIQLVPLLTARTGKRINMKQGEQIMAAVGCGAAIIREISNDAEKPIPKLTIMMPGEVGRIVNGGFADQAIYNHPAESFELSGDRVEELYKLLRSYYKTQATS